MKNLRNVWLIQNLIYLEEQLDKNEMVGEFYDIYHPYALMETIEFITNKDFRSGKDYKKFIKDFKKEYGTLEEFIKN